MTFPVAEENFLEVLKKRAGALAPEKLREIQTKMAEELSERAKRPQPLPLSEATSYRSFYFDPSVELQQDISNHKGDVLFTKGTRVSPLQTIQLRSGMLFIDGDNPDHIAWAKTQGSNSIEEPTGSIEPATYKWVLVRGSPIDCEKEQERPIYFDLGGTLTDHFGLRHVPAKIYQVGQRLFVEECPISPGTYPAGEN